ncbi:hypothetical protein [Halobacterium hubeiense]|uniref:hypothetical protein n=1 Tax=Halobacterium hubeiense TaxID=1407499 RepID=UPI003C7248A9
MDARDLLLFGIAVVLANGFLLVHDVVRYDRGTGLTGLFYYGVFVGLALALVGTLASSGD